MLPAVEALRPRQISCFGPLSRHRPWFLALVGYLLVTTLMLGGSIRPGRTLMPADILAHVPPYQEVVDGSGVHNGLPSDAPLQFYPVLAFFTEEARDGHVPQWNPRILGGVPMSPNGFVPTNYPPSFLVLILHPFDVYNVFVVLHLVIAALGGYALGREFGVRPLLSWFTGFGILLGATWFHWSLHLVHLVGMAWLPLVLASVHRAVRQPSRSSIAAIGVTFGLWWLGGNPQYCYFGSLALALVTAGLLARHRRDPHRFLRAAGAMGSGIALGALLAAPTLVPTLALMDDVVRVREPVATMAGSHLRPVELIELVLPEVGGSGVGNVLYRPDRYGGHQMDTPFVGITMLILGVTAVIGGRSPSRWVVITAAVAAVVLAFAAWPHHLLHPLLPGYDRFRASSRWLAVLPAVVSPLSALGLAGIVDGSRRARAVALAACAAVAALLASIALIISTDEAAPHRFFAGRLAAAAVPAALCVGAILLVRWRRQVAVGVIGMAIVIEVLLQVPRWYPSVVEATAYPDVAVASIARQNGGRIARFGPRSFMPTFPSNIPMAYGLDDAQGLAVLLPKAADRYLRLVEDYGSFASSFNSPPPITDPALVASPLLDVLDVRTVIFDGQGALPAPATLALPRHSLYTRPSLGPAVLVASARPATDDQMWASVADPTWDPKLTASVVGLPQPVTGSGGSVLRTDYSADEERWEVGSTSGGLLRVGAAYHRGWSATIDGERAEVYISDGMFRSVVVPPGNHEVQFRFRNPAEEDGRKLALFGLVLLLGLFLLPILRARVSMHRDTMHHRK